LATFPERALAWANATLAGLSDVILALLLGLPPLVSLLIVSFVTAALILPVVARTSNQQRMVATKRGIHASLLEVRLFNDDLRAVMRALGDALRHNVIYLRLSLVPLAWLAIPLALVVMHLQPFYGYAGLALGMPALVKVELRHAPTRGDAARAALEAPAEIRVETDAVRLASTNEILWRIVPTAIGTYTLTVRIGATTATKTVQVSDHPARRSPRRVSPSLVDQLLYPSEAPLFDDGAIAAITLPYPEPGIAVLSWRVHWMVVYAVLSMGCALLLARRFGITL
jgi:hypothetical protein